MRLDFACKVFVTLKQKPDCVRNPKAILMESEPKRRRIQKAPPRRIPTSAQATEKEKNAVTESDSVVSRTSGSSLRTLQARIHAVAQAKQDGATGNFKVFDSQYGNYLITVIPSRAELSG